WSFVASDDSRIETVERNAIRLALLENRAPAQARLRPFENQELEQETVIMNRNAPFPIVVVDHRVIGPGPRTTHEFLLAFHADHRPPVASAPTGGKGRGGPTRRWRNLTSVL